MTTYRIKPAAYAEAMKEHTSFVLPTTVNAGDVIKIIPESQVIDLSMTTNLPIPMLFWDDGDAAKPITSLLSNVIKDDDGSVVMVIDINGVSYHHCAFDQGNWVSYGTQVKWYQEIGCPLPFGLRVKVLNRKGNISVIGTSANIDRWPHATGTEALNPKHYDLDIIAFSVYGLEIDWHYSWEKTQ